MWSGPTNLWMPPRENFTISTEDDNSRHIGSRRPQDMKRNHYSMYFFLFSMISVFGFRCSMFNVLTSATDQPRLDPQDKIKIYKIKVMHWSFWMGASKMELNLDEPVEIRKLIENWKLIMCSDSAPLLPPSFQMYSNDFEYRTAIVCWSNITFRKAMGRSEILISALHKQSSLFIDKVDCGAPAVKFEYITFIVQH